MGSARYKTHWINKLFIFHIQWNESIEGRSTVGIGAGAAAALVVAVGFPVLLAKFAIIYCQYRKVLKHRL